MAFNSGQAFTEAPRHPSALRFAAVLLVAAALAQNDTVPALSSECVYTRTSSVLQSCSASGDSVSSVTPRLAVASLLHACINDSADPRARGRPLRFVAPDTSLMTLISQLANTSFAQATGIEVDFDLVPFVSYVANRQRYLQDPEPPNATGGYDILMATATAFGDASRVPGKLPDLSYLVAGDSTLNWNQIPAQFRAVGPTYDGSVRALPLAYSPLLTIYRRDIFERDNLMVPQTWEEFAELAERYHRGPDGLVGTCVVPIGCRTESVMLRAIFGSYVQTEGLRHGVFWDPDTLEPLVNTPAMQAALTIFRRLTKVGPTQSDAPGCQRFPFIRGQCLLTIADGGTYKYCSLGGAEPTRVRGLMGFALMPGSTRVLDRTTRQLVPCTEERCPLAQGRTAEGVPVNRPVAVSSVVLLVNGLSPFQYQFFAYHLAAFMSSPAVIGTKGLLMEMNEISPVRAEDTALSNVPLWVARGYDEGDTTSFLTTYSELMRSSNINPDVRVQLTTNVTDALLAASLTYNDVTLNASLVAVMGRLEAVLAGIVAAEGRNAFATEYRRSLNWAPLSPATPPPAAPPAGHSSAAGSDSQRRMSITVGSICGGLLAVSLGAAVLLVRHRRRLARRLGAAVVEAPGVGPQTTLCVTDIQDSTTLWEELPAGMNEALDVHHGVIRRLLLAHRGYECLTEGDSFIVAFHTVASALQFCLEAQQALLDAPWPRELLRHESAVRGSLGESPTAEIIVYDRAPRSLTSGVHGPRGRAKRSTQPQHNPRQQRQLPPPPPLRQHHADGQWAVVNNPLADTGQARCAGACGAGVYVESVSACSLLGNDNGGGGAGDDATRDTLSSPLQMLHVESVPAAAVDNAPATATASTTTHHFINVMSYTRTSLSPGAEGPAGTCLIGATADNTSANADTAASAFDLPLSSGCMASPVSEVLELCTAQAAAVAASTAAVACTPSPFAQAAAAAAELEPATAAPPVPAGGLRRAGSYEPVPQSEGAANFDHTAGCRPKTSPGKSKRWLATGAPVAGISGVGQPPRSPSRDVLSAVSSASRPGLLAVSASDLARLLGFGARRQPRLNTGPCVHPQPGAAAPCPLASSPSAPGEIEVDASDLVAVRECSAPLEQGGAVGLGFHMAATRDRIGGAARMRDGRYRLRPRLVQPPGVASGTGAAAALQELQGGMARSLSVPALQRPFGSLAKGAASRGSDHRQAALGSPGPTHTHPGQPYAAQGSGQRTPSRLSITRRLTGAPSKNPSVSSLLDMVRRVSELGAMRAAGDGQVGSASSTGTDASAATSGTVMATGTVGRISVAGSRTGAGVARDGVPAAPVCTTLDAVLRAQWRTSQGHLVGGPSDDPAFGAAGSDGGGSLARATAKDVTAMAAVPGTHAMELPGGGGGGGGGRGDMGHGTMVFRGLRVRAGLSCGVLSEGEIVRDSRNGRVQYSGRCMRLAKLVSDAAHGGMVLIPDAARAVLEAGSSEGGAAGLLRRCQPVVVWMGRHSLSPDLEDVHLFQVVPQPLVARLALLQRPLRTLGMQRPLTGALGAPVGVGAAAQLSVPGVRTLMAWNAGVTGVALDILYGAFLDELQSVEGRSYVLEGALGLRGEAGGSSCTWGGGGGGGGGAVATAGCGVEFSGSATLSGLLTTAQPQLSGAGAQRTPALACPDSFALAPVAGRGGIPLSSAVRPGGSGAVVATGMPLVPPPSRPRPSLVRSGKDGAGGPRPGVMTAVFDSADAAATWLLRVMEVLPSVTWPADLLEHPLCEPVDLDLLAAVVVGQQPRDASASQQQQQPHRPSGGESPARRAPGRRDSLRSKLGTAHASRLAGPNPNPRQSATLSSVHVEPPEDAVSPEIIPGAGVGDAGSVGVMDLEGEANQQPTRQDPAFPPRATGDIPSAAAFVTPPATAAVSPGPGRTNALPSAAGPARGQPDFAGLRASGVLSFGELGGQLPGAGSLSGQVVYRGRAWQALNKMASKAKVGQVCTNATTQAQLHPKLASMVVVRSGQESGRMAPTL